MPPSSCRDVTRAVAAAAAKAAAAIAAVVTPFVNDPPPSLSPANCCCGCGCGCCAALADVTSPAAVGEERWARLPKEARAVVGVRGRVSALDSNTRLAARRQVTVAPTADIRLADVVAVVVRNGSRAVGHGNGVIRLFF